MHPRGRLMLIVSRWRAEQQTSRDVSYALLGSAGQSVMHPWGRLVRRLCTLGVGWSALSAARPIEISNAPSGSAGSALYPRGRAGHQCQPVRVLHQSCTQAVDVARDLLMDL